MKNKKILLSVTLFLLASLIAAILIIDSYKKNHRQLKQAQQFIYQNKIPKASKLFHELIESRWVKEQARLGQTITAILNEEDNNSQPLPEPEAITIDDYQLYSLLKRTFRKAAFVKCIKLAELGQNYGHQGANLYLSAALLETGNTKQAYNLYRRLPDRFKYTQLGNRLKETFTLLQEGAYQIVRDRKGKLLGSIDAARKFHYHRPGYRTLIQPVIIKELLNTSIKKGVRLSIDLELSFLAYEALADQRGSIVLVKPDNGEILAAISDRRTAKKMGRASAMRASARRASSPAFEQMLEPASISKLITTTAAFRNQLDPEKEIAGKKCRGSRRFDGKILYCPSARQQLESFEQALAVSCNTSFADLGVKLGWENMLAELRLFGFDSHTNNPIPMGKIIIPSGDRRSLADLSIGLENTVITPVHGAMIAAVFANNGRWFYPELVHGDDGLTGLTPHNRKSIKGVAKGKKILEESWLPAIHNAMWAVTQYRGTAGFIAPSGFTVHMKTGTGGTYRDGFHINYIGYAPADNTKDNIAFCVRVNGKRSSYRVRRAGYRVNRDLLYRIKQYWQLHY
jgi:penicillin-binding protein A